MIERLSPHVIWEQWNLEPQVLVPLSVIFVLYSVGLARFSVDGSAAMKKQFGQWLAFATGSVAVATAILSPLDALASQFISAHMVQHLLLVLVAPPLFMASSASRVLLSLMPQIVIGWWRRMSEYDGVTRRAWSLVNRPFVVSLSFAAVLWTWHMPYLYELALEHEWLHSFEHLTFFFAAFAFWARVLSHNQGSQRRIAFGASIIYAFIMALQTGILGAALTFASKPWYANYVQTSASWGIRPLDDQQLAGLFLWIPGITAFVGAAIVLFVLWLNSVEKELRERERQVKIECGVD